MTRKTPSRTKRELRKLRRHDSDEDDGLKEIRVGFRGVPPRGPDDDPEDVPNDDRRTIDLFTLDFATGEVESVEGPGPDDLAECVEDGCDNPSMPVEGKYVCEVCIGMPEPDRRPVVRENERGGEVE